MRRSAILATVILCLAPAAHAEVPAGGPVRLDQAIAELEPLAAAARAQGSLPRWSDVQATHVLMKIWDGDAILGAAPYSANDVPLLMGIGEKSQMVLKSYMLFSADPAKLPDTEHNNAIFQDEITRATAFQLRATAAASEALADFIASLTPADFNDARKQGLAMVRLGHQQIIAGAALMLRSPGLSGANRRLLAEALAQNASGLAAATTLADRQTVIATLKAVASGDEVVQADIERTVVAFSSTDCAGLCVIPQ